MIYTNLKKRIPAEDYVMGAGQTNALESGSVPNSAMLGNAQPTATEAAKTASMPISLRQKMESAFGADFSGIKMVESQRVADGGADAITLGGGTIGFAPGKLDFNSKSGQELIGHELSHVVSHARGEVTGSGFLGDSKLEAQADSQGAAAAAGQSVYSGPVTPLSASSIASAQGPMQAKKGGGMKRKKTQYRIGKKLKEKDKAIEAAMSEHEAESADMESAMAGFSDEEKEAQRLFQKINRGDYYGEKRQEAQNLIFNSEEASALEDQSDLGSFMANVGRGTLTAKSREKLAAREQSFADSTGYNPNDMARADELTSSISKRMRAQSVLGAMETDKNNKKAAFEAAYDRYQTRNGSKAKSKDSGDTYVWRYLQRHLVGLDDKKADTVMEDMLSGDATRSAPYVREAVGHFMEAANPDSISSESSDEDLVNNFLSQALLSQDNMTVSDMVGHGGDSIMAGLKPEEQEEFSKQLDAYKAKKKALGDNLLPALARVRNLAK